VLHSRDEARAPKCLSSDTAPRSRVVTCSESIGLLPAVKKAVSYVRFYDCSCRERRFLVHFLFYHHLYTADGGHSALTKFDLCKWTLSPARPFSGGHITPKPTLSRFGRCFFAYGEYKQDYTKRERTDAFINPILTFGNFISRRDGPAALGSLMNTSSHTYAQTPTLPAQ
jgi:hypothetical protein